MSVDMFLTLSGIEGESVDQRYAKAIDIDSWEWGMSQSGSTHTARGGGAGKVRVHDVIVHKRVDKSSANLLRVCCTGKHLESAVLTVRKAGEKPLDYMQLVMKDVLLTDVQLDEGKSVDLMTEVVTLNFAEFKFVYVPQRSDGGADGRVETGFHIAQNRLL